MRRASRAIDSLSRLPGAMVFGAFAPSLATQLDRKPSEVALWQKDADAITRLLIRRLIPEATGRAARRKLLRTIVKGAACLLLILLTFTCSACARPVVLVIPGPLTHDIGLWGDDDLLCVAPTIVQQLYVRRRCLPMRTVRALILQTRFALAADPQTKAAR